MMLLSSLLGLTAIISQTAMAAPPPPPGGPGGPGGPGAPSKNPQFHNAASHPAADPFVLFDAASSLYYAYSTEGAPSTHNFAIYSSPDLATWHLEGGVLRACKDADGNDLDNGQACWAKDWFWAPEAYYNEKTGWYFFFFAGRLREGLAAENFRYSEFEEPSKLGVAVSRSPTGPWEEIKSQPIEYFPFDPEYHDVNLIMDEKQMKPPTTKEEGEKAPKGTYIPHIDVNIFFDDDERVYLYVSRNAYRNWNWDEKLGKYIEESNIIAVEMDRAWWDDPEAKTMPEIIESQKDANAKNAPKPPCNTKKYNGTGELGKVPRKDGYTTVISYGKDPQEWENYHVDDYEKFNGEKKDRRWSEGSTLLKRKGKDGNSVYVLLYSANNYEASNYGVGYATSSSPLGPFKKASQNPILSQDPDAEIPALSTGHGSVVASPPKQGWEKVGAQDVTLQTPKDAELFYIHHGRNTTEDARSMYTTRMKIDEKKLFVGTNDAITMELTTQDQALPKNTFPLKLEATCSKGDEKGYLVRVESRIGGLFDLKEASNRVVGLPGDKQPTKISEGEDGQLLVEFEKDVKEVAYQRESVDGKWKTVEKKAVHCK